MVVRPSLRARPRAVFEVASAQDVAEAFRFARRFGLVTRPRSGGHSYVGASTVGGPRLDVRRLSRVLQRVRRRNDPDRFLRSADTV